MAATPARVRIAPSPTGDPHVGTAYTGLFNWMLARKTGGQFLLRIEDTDRQRSTRESEEAILSSLRWLGLDWDEGPDVGGPYAPYRQSERTAIYVEHVQLLIERGGAYRCYCTAERLAAMREEQKKAKSDFGYDGLCRNLDAGTIARHEADGTPYVVRLAVDREGQTIVHDLLRGELPFQNTTIDDQVLLKSDGFPTYHLANVVDDHLMKITHVLRAEEWITSTPKHVLLYQAFGFPAPVFCHLPLLRNSDRSKISKRKNPTSLNHYRENGYLPEAMLNFLGLMGFSPSGGDGSEVFTKDQLKDAFEPEKISLGGPVFDLTKLEWLNGEWIRRLTDGDLADRIEAYLPAGRVIERPLLLRLLPLVRERLKRLTEFDQWTDFFFIPKVALDADSFERTRAPAPAMRQILQRSHEVLSEHPDLVAERDEPRLREACTRLGAKVGTFFMTLRVAITGKSATPPLLECMEILGREKSLQRIRDAVEFLQSHEEPAEL